MSFGFEKSLGPVTSEMVIDEIKKLVADSVGKVLTQLEVAQEGNCRLLERAKRAESRVEEMTERICKGPDEVERVANSIGWLQPGHIDFSSRINEAIDMLRAQAARIYELESNERKGVSDVG